MNMQTHIIVDDAGEQLAAAGKALHKARKLLESLPDDYSSKDTLLLCVNATGHNWRHAYDLLCALDKESMKNVSTLYIAWLIVAKIVHLFEGPALTAVVMTIGYMLGKWLLP